MTMICDCTSRTGWLVGASMIPQRVLWAARTILACESSLTALLKLRRLVTRLASGPACGMLSGHGVGGAVLGPLSCRFFLSLVANWAPFSTAQPEDPIFRLGCQCISCVLAQSSWRKVSRVMPRERR